jgi:hypothetical protein
LRCFIAVALVAVGVVVGAAPAASAAGSITVTPNTGLHDGDVVSVNGTGWIPNSQVGVCQSDALDPPSINNCNNGTGSLLTADGSGNISTTWSVLRFINVPALGRTVDCADPTAPCQIGAAEFNDIAGTAVGVTLHFAPAPPQIQVTNASVPEGDSGTTPLVFPVTLSYSSTQTATVQWNTLPAGEPTGCTADPGSDYIAASGTVTFAPGVTTQSVTTSVNGDTIVEPNECFGVSFHDPVNATLAQSPETAAGTILNDDQPLTVVPGTGSVIEGDSGTTALHVAVTLNHASTATVTVPWETFTNPGPPSCQADPTNDYTPASGTVTFAPGVTAQSVTITVNGDTVVEPNECVLVHFHDATNAVVGGYIGIGVGTILNDDQPLTVIPGTGSVTEGNSGTTPLTVAVTLNHPSTATVTVQWNTFTYPPSCQADPTNDYTPASGTVTFAPGVTTQSVTISVNGDTVIEPDECVLVHFHNATNAVVGGYLGIGVGTILNDDS